jgi:hypothetical protein
MAEENETTALLRKMCALQEQQLAKLGELVDVYSHAAASNEASRAQWEKQLQLYEASQKTYDKRAARHERDVRIRGIITLILWAAITVAVLVHYFF